MTSADRKQMLVRSRALEPDMENLLRVGCLDIVCCPAGHVPNSL